LPVHQRTTASVCRGKPWSRIQGYWLATDTDAAAGALVAADNAPDLYIKLLWRRFGLAIPYEGELKEIYPDIGFFCIGLEEQ
jgi:hypothetical protein